MVLRVCSSFAFFVSDIELSREKASGNTVAVFTSLVIASSVHNLPHSSYLTNTHAVFQMLSSGFRKYSFLLLITPCGRDEELRLRGFMLAQITARKWETSESASRLPLGAYPWPLLCPSSMRRLPGATWDGV